jgi:hypothetical protein
MATCGAHRLREMQGTFVRAHEMEREGRRERQERERERERE